MAMMKAIKVQVVVTKTMWVYEDEFYEDAGNIGIEFNEQNAIMFVKGQMIQDMQNDPNRGSSKILDYGTYDDWED